MHIINRKYLGFINLRIASIGMRTRMWIWIGKWIIVDRTFDNR